MFSFLSTDQKGPKEKNEECTERRRRRWQVCKRDWYKGYYDKKMKDSKTNVKSGDRREFVLKF